MIGLLVKDNTSAGARLMRLVQTEALAWKSGERSEYQRVTFNLQRGVYDALKGIASATRHPNTKRSIGVGLLMETILTKWVEKYTRMQTGELEPKDEPQSDKRPRPEIKPN